MRLFKRDPEPIIIGGPQDYGKIPPGFFRTLLADGSEKLGYAPPPVFVDRQGTTKAARIHRESFRVGFGEPDDVEYEVHDPA